MDPFLLGLLCEALVRSHLVFDLLGPILHFLSLDHIYIFPPLTFHGINILIHLYGWKHILASFWFRNQSHQHFVKL